MEATTHGVVGRASERAEAAAFLERSTRGCEALFLLGDPGIGKTAMWQEILELGRDRTVLVHRASEMEARLSFTALSDLLRESRPGHLAPVDSVARAFATLPAPRRRALEAALLLREPDGETADPRRLGLAVLDLLRILSRDQPVVVAIDDLQWLDEASGDALRFALRRLRDEPIGVVASVRGTAATASSITLTADLPPGRSRVVELGPLSPAELHHLLRERLSLDLSRPQLLRLHDLTGGNPYFALELGAELIRTGARLDGSHLPALPASLEALLGARLDGLPHSSLRIIQIAAASARPDVRLLAKVAGSRADVETAIEDGERMGILRLDGDRLAFTHPLLASVCYRRISAMQRRRLHGWLAAVVRDPDEAAQHLARSTSHPDARIAARLGRAAERAAAHGATSAAAELAERAAELTPAERAADARSHRRRAAELLRLSGDLDRSAAILRRLVDESPPGGEMADALFSLARTRRTDLQEALALCEAALQHSAGDHRRLADVLSYVSWLHQIEGRIPEALRQARAAVVAAEATRDPVLLTRTLARAAMEELWAMDHTPGLLERGVAIEQSISEHLAYYDRPSLTLARRFALMGEYREARAIYEAAERDARERGEDVSRGRILFHLALVEWYDGQPVRALALAADAVELADQLHDDQYRSMALHAASFIDAHLGLHDRASAAATEGLRLAEQVGDSLFSLAHRNVLGFIDLSVGNSRAAAGRLIGLPDEPISRVWVEPAFNPIWPNAIEAAALVGELATARQHLAELERRAIASISEWSRAIASRCRGLIEAAAGDLEAADGAFARAAEAHTRIRAPFDRGRTFLAWGGLHRRRKQKRLARETLAEAQREFAAIGAHRWADRAVAELSRVGGRSPADRILTPTQRRVARLAATGLSNKEIAASLGCAVSTVEAHLTRVYARVQARSRVELGRLIADLEVDRYPDTVND